MNRKNVIIAGASASAGVAVVAGVLVAVRFRTPITAPRSDEVAPEYLPYRDAYLDDLLYAPQATQ